MKPVAVIITLPNINFNTLLQVTDKALGYSIAASSDRKSNTTDHVEKYLSCLAAIRDQHAPAGLSANLFYHVSFSVLVIAEELDTLSVLECAAGMPFVTKETLAHGVDLSIIHGSLAQWKDAVVSGTRRGGNVQSLYCSILGQFEAMNLDLWQAFNKRWDEGLFVLEDKRK